VSGTPLYSWTLSRDNAGRITQKTDVMPLGGVVWDYAYDPLGRLKEVKQSGSIVESYEYDANGNRTFETNAFRGTSNRAYTDLLEDHSAYASSAGVFPPR
jgi:YD repeat-containing protein